MNYLVSASTDIGLTKKTNQDSFGVKVMDTRLGKMAFAILCDGMGGLSYGEVASATVVQAYENWAVTSLPQLCESGVTDDIIRKEWLALCDQCNERLKKYGEQVGSPMNVGTTAVILLLTETRYFILNLGDSRAYRIDRAVSVLTRDHSEVALKIARGELQPEQEKTYARRSVLLQGIGVTEKIVPDFYAGRTEKDTVYMLCSDGFRHEITEAELYQFLNPSALCSVEQMKQNMDTLIDMNKQRNERDNISVITVRTYI